MRDKISHILGIARNELRRDTEIKLNKAIIRLSFYRQVFSIFHDGSINHWPHEFCKRSQKCILFSVKKLLFHRLNWWQMTTGLFTVHLVVIGISDIYWFLSKSASTFVFFSFFNPLFEYFELILLRLNNLALDLKYLTIQTM